MIAAADAAVEPMSPEVAIMARHCIVDWLGVALRGSREPVARRARAAATTWSGCDVPPSAGATVLGRPERAGALDAALLNGIAGHALDFDDTNLDGFDGHATAAILPGALALAETRDTPLHALVDALVAGVGGATALGRRMNPAHYDAGWHATATLGTFGAAIACARLAGADAPGRHRALGLAALQAAGLTAAFGSMGKPLQVGKAAANGLLSALLAEQGVDAPEDILDGVPAVYGGRPGRWPEAPAGRAILRTAFKAHAACHGTHAAIELVRRLRSQQMVGPGDVERLELAVAPALLRICDVETPRTGLQAKFSLRAAAALTLCGDDTGDPATFADARVRDPQVRELAARVTVVADASLTEWQARATLRLTDGRAMHAAADVTAREHDLIGQAAGLERKFSALASPVLGGDRAAEVARTAMALDARTSVRDLTAALRVAA